MIDLKKLIYIIIYLIWLNLITYLFHNINFYFTVLIIIVTQIIKRIILIINKRGKTLYIMLHYVLMAIVNYL